MALATKTYARRVLLSSLKVGYINFFFLLRFLQTGAPDTRCSPPDVFVNGSLVDHDFDDDVREIQFEGQVGPEPQTTPCKIRCINGAWVGPICTNGKYSVLDYSFQIVPHNLVVRNKNLLTRCILKIGQFHFVAAYQLTHIIEYFVHVHVP